MRQSTLKYAPLNPPVSQEEITRKLPICASITCPLSSGGCPYCVTLETVDPLFAVAVCTRPKL